jgi:hypothetical protein
MSNLEERRNSQIISYVNKALHKNCPQGISEMFQFSHNVNHNLRSNDLMLRLANPKINAMKKSFSYMPLPTSGTLKVLPRERK